MVKYLIMPTVKRVKETKIDQTKEITPTPETTPEIVPVPEVSQEAVSDLEIEGVPGVIVEKEIPAQQEVEIKIPAQPTVEAKEIVAPVVEDKLEQEIEKVLEENLKDIYLLMPPEKRAEFKIKGEEIRSVIRQLVDSAKVNAKKIFKLIRSWLKLIPGINRFFLEQEAKIKTDKILLLSEEERKRSIK